MDAETGSLARAIGERVRQERLSRTWTLDRLADEAGVSRRMVVNVEQGVANPSVGTLLRLSSALGVGLPALVEPESNSVEKVTPHGRGAVLWTGPSGGRGVLVASTHTPHVLELWDWTLNAHERHDSEPHVRGARELLLVRMGQLIVEVDGVAYDLGPEDALAFSGDVPHAYANPGAEPSIFTLTVFEPRPESNAPKEHTVV